MVEIEPEELEDEEDDSVSFEFKNALVQAKIYNQTMAFSKQGLFAKLTSPYGGKFPDDAVQYAIDNLE
ncbi:MAG: Ltp family lipoprotein [bacterium]